MKLCTRALAAFACLMLAQAQLSALPPVSEEYSQMAAGMHTGKPLNEIINPEDVSSIGLIENRGKGHPITAGFRPQWDSNELIQAAFSSKEKAQDWAQRATEGSYARYALVTKKGDLYLLDILCDQIRGNGPTALILRGRGFGCRINLPEN
jgi:hypothetical protein